MALRNLEAARRPRRGYVREARVEVAVSVRAFHEGLAETGFVEGRNVTVEYRAAEGEYGRLPALAVPRDGSARLSSAPIPSSILRAKGSPR
jgi:hypothetical protein